MDIASATQRVILDATLDHSVIRGTLTAPAGERREFHGWLELNTMLEAILGTADPTWPARAPTPCRPAPR